MSANFTNDSSSQQNGTCESLEALFPVRVTKIAVLSIILLFSSVGNLLLIIMVYKRKELRKTVNYFIVNMAVSDLVFPLTAIPIELAKTSASSSWQWPIGGTAGLAFCKLKNFLTVFSVTVSIGSLVCIALDRFVAVVLPMKIHFVSSRLRVVAIMSTWIFAFIVNSLDLYVSELVEENGKMTCQRKNNTLLGITYGYVRMALLNITPLLLITALYCAIAFTLRRQAKVLRCSAVRQNDLRKRQAIKMSFCVIASFYFFFLPFVITVLLWKPKAEMSCLLFNMTWLFSHSSLTIYLSSTSNPIICFTFVESYRRGLKEMFDSCHSRSPKTGHVETRGQEEITLQRIRVMPEMEENLARYRNMKDDGVNLAFKQN